jgi:hypothetical protein
MIFAGSASSSLSEVEVESGAASRYQESDLRY